MFDIFMYLGSKVIVYVGVEIDIKQRLFKVRISYKLFGDLVSIFLE